MVARCFYFYRCLCKISNNRSKHNLRTPLTLFRFQNLSEEANVYSVVRYFLIETQTLSRS